MLKTIKHSWNNAYLPAEACDEVFVCLATSCVSENALFILLARSHVDHRNLVRLSTEITNYPYNISPTQPCASLDWNNKLSLQYLTHTTLCVSRLK